jgi:arabinoxylan arabinofuranohydrolase
MIATRRYTIPVVTALSLGLFAVRPSTSFADNPIVQTLYTADPAVMVHGETLYLYTTHDEDVTVKKFFTMNDWRVYSSTDAVNWTDHGSPLRYTDFAWARGDAWAGQVIARNGKFYFYVPINRINGGSVIGVGIADSPIGPFRDALGRPLITSDCGDIDPSAFIDDDGQAYLYWGNPNLCYVKLNEDMTSYQGDVVRVPLTTASFGTRSKPDRPTTYEEGPWFYKREGRYYLVFAAGPISEHIGYSTSPGPTGPWTYRGVVMPTQGGSFTNHPSVIDYKGKSFFFYHNGALPGGGGFHRSVSVEQFSYGPDGSIPQLRMTTEGAAAVATLNPFARTEAETIAWEKGIETEACSEGGVAVTSIDKGDYIKVKEVEFGGGATSFAARVASASGGGAIELRLDSVKGTLIGTCAVPKTGGAQTWATELATVSGVTGKHDLFLKFTGGGFKFNWWQFSGPGDPGAAGTGGTGSVGGASGVSGLAPTGGGGAAGGTFAIGGAPSEATGSIAPSKESTSGSVVAGGSTGIPTNAEGPVGTAGTGSIAGSAGVRPSSDADSCSYGVVRARSPWSALAALGVLGALALRSSHSRRSGNARRM